MALTPFLKLLFRSPEEIDPATRATYYITLYGGLLAILIHSLFIVIFKLAAVDPLYYFNYLSVAVYLYCYYLVRLRDHFHAGMLIATLEVLVHQALAVYYLGWDCGFQYYLVSIASFVFAGRFRNLLIPIGILVASSVLLTWLYFIGQHLYTPHYPIDETLCTLLYWFNLAASGFLVALFALISELTRRSYEAKLLAIQDNLYFAATTDVLTGLLNRRRTQEHIDQELVRSRRNGHPFVLAIGDVDNFKQINDTYGHDVGDLVLIRLAMAMRRMLREQDIIGRWGGEEFVLLLPNTGLDDGLHVMEKLRQAISALEITHGEQPLVVTMTFGVALADAKSNADRLITLADQALYRGKQTTKNCVVAAGTETEPA